MASCHSCHGFIAAVASLFAVASGHLAVTRIVHQQFWSSNSSTWPPEWRSLSSYWQAQNWTWRFWTDEEEAQLFKEELPELEDFYHWIPNCLDAKISQADLSAYAILYVHGGLYADMDTMPLAPLDHLLESALASANHPLVLLPSISRQEEDEVRGIGGLEEPYGLDTDLMVSTAPRHPFFLEVLHSIRDYVTTHNKTVCGRDRGTPTYDLMFLTAWGRLSMCARAWTEQGLNHSQLRFLEGLFLREPVDATLAHLALHTLSHRGLEQLQQHPPPSGGLRLERWLERMLSTSKGSDQRRQESLHLEVGEVSVLFQASNLLLAPIAVSPAYEKHQLRELHLKCRDNSSCFLGHVASVARRQFPERDQKYNFMLVFNDDGGVWEGSWDKAQQEAFRVRAAASPLAADEL